MEMRNINISISLSAPPPPPPQFYLQARLTWRGARLLRPLVQFLLVMIAVYTGLTRISDYRHHPSDVVTGFLQGALTAYWVVGSSEGQVACVQTAFRGLGGICFPLIRGLLRQ